MRIVFLMHNQTEEVENKCVDFFLYKVRYKSGDECATKHCTIIGNSYL